MFTNKLFIDFVSHSWVNDSITSFCEEELHEVIWDKASRFAAWRIAFREEEPICVLAALSNDMWHDLAYFESKRVEVALLKEVENGVETC